VVVKNWNSICFVVAWIWGSANTNKLIALNKRVTSDCHLQDDSRLSIYKTSGGTVTRTVTYYPAGGAMRINSTLYYILKDHLGSASVETDATGVTVGEQRYYPYGETRISTGTIYTDKLFTGQRDTGLGIYDYNARFYSPKLGRFLSADTIVPNPFNPQDLNRFSYVRNNPLRYIDPTGHMVACGVMSAACDGNSTPPTPLPAPSPKPVPNPSPTPSPTPTPIPSPTPSPIPSPTPSPIPTTIPSPTPTQTPTPSLTSTNQYTGAQSPVSPSSGINPPIVGLVFIAVVLHLTTVITELGVVGAEYALAAGPEELVPELAIPLAVIIGAGGIAVGDGDVAFLSYTAHVAFNPEVHQDFILLPPWGWSQ